MTYRVLSCCYSVTLAIAVQTAEAADVTPYPRPPGDQPHAQYSVTVADKPIDTVGTVMQVGYAHFAFQGKVRVEITVHGPIASFDLSPHRLRIKATAKGNTLSFAIDQPCKLHLRINKLERFFLFADAPETEKPDPARADVLALEELGIKSSDSENQTQSLQHAIDSAAAQNAVLYVTPGIYRAGTLRFPSNLQLYLAPGAIVKGTAKLSDYVGIRGEPAQLDLQDAQNVRIYGRGVIDNNGFTLRSQFLPDRRRGRTKMLVARRSRDLVVEDVILRDSGVWCIHVVESSDMDFRNLKIISAARSETGPDTSHNTDAFDPDNSSRILMENNFLSVDDDAIAIKLKSGRRQDMHDIVFRNNVIWNMCSALKIGTEVHDHTVRNVLFENNDIVHTDTAIVVQCYRGGYVDGVTWIGNHFEQVGRISNNSPHRKGANIYINTRSENNFGEIRNLLIENNTFEGFSNLPSMIRAAGSKQVVNGVIIKNLVIDKHMRESASDAQIKVDKGVQNVLFQ